MPGGPTFEGEALLTRTNVEEPLNNKPAESTTQNTFLGPEAASALTNKGESNIAVGAKALKVEKTGQGNIAIGKNAAEETNGTSNNIAIGTNAFQKGQGNSNIAIGEGTLKVAEGPGEKGFENVAVGGGALTALTEGKENVAIGPTAGGATTTGSKNTYIGKSAGSGPNTGSENVAIGYNTNGGGEAGKQNVYIGVQAGEGKKGSNSIYIGFQAGKGSATVSNKLVIANNATTALVNGVMSATEASQEIGFLGAAAVKRPKVSGKRTAEFATVLETLCKGLGELGLITDETIP